MKIFFLAAVNSNHPQPLGLHRIVSGDESAIARATQIFRRKKTEATKIADGAGKSFVVTGAYGLRGIFDDQKIVGLGDLQDGVKIGRQTKKVNRQDGCGARPDSL